MNVFFFNLAKHCFKRRRHIVTNTLGRPVLVVLCIKVDRTELNFLCAKSKFIYRVIAYHLLVNKFFDSRNS